MNTFRCFMRSNSFLLYYNQQALYSILEGARYHLLLTQIIFIFSSLVFFFFVRSARVIALLLGEHVSNYRWKWNMRPIRQLFVKHIFFRGIFHSTCFFLFLFRWHSFFCFILTFANWIFQFSSFSRSFGKLSIHSSDVKNGSKHFVLSWNRKGKWYLIS